MTEKRKRSRPLPSTLEEVVRQYGEPRPITEELVLEAELDGISDALESAQLPLVQSWLDYRGHADIAARLGTAADDLTAAIKDAYNVLPGRGR